MYNTPIKESSYKLKVVIIDEDNTGIHSIGIWFKNVAKKKKIVV